MVFSISSLNTDLIDLSIGCLDKNLHKYNLIMGFLNTIYLFLPFLYLIVISVSSQNQSSIVSFNLKGGLVILYFYMISLIFVDGADKPVYLDSYLDAENYYNNYDRELLWGKLQLFLSSFLFKNEILYWFFYSFFYCISYFFVSKRCFPYKYAGYFVLCVISCMGFVSYGSNTIRAGFGIAMLIMAFSIDRKIIKLCLAIVSIGCQMSMILPVCSYFAALHLLKKHRWCEYVWLLCLLISSTTSVISDIMTLFASFDARAEGMVNYSGTSDVYNVGFRFDFVLYSIIPILFVKYNIKNLINNDYLYLLVYRIYLLSNAIWLLLIRIPFSDRVAYLSWFMIPFLLMYPVLNGSLNTRHPQSYILKSIGFFALVHLILSLK